MKKWIVLLLMFIPAVLCAADLSPREKEVVLAVQRYDGYGTKQSIKDNIVMYLSVTKIDHEVEVIGWGVRQVGKSYNVKFWFKIDGKKQYAEWFYGSGSGIVDPLNYWARLFSGE